MATRPPPVSYSTVQMSLHWLIVALVAIQFAFNDSMSRALHDAVEQGGYAMREGGMVSHAVIGGAIFVAMLTRLGLRLKRGVPPAPTTESRPVQILSRATHWAFYAVLLAMPVIGALALFLISPTLGALHSAASWVLLAIIALHVAGALHHWIKPGSEAHRRMLSAGPSDRRLD